MESATIHQAKDGFMPPQIWLSVPAWKLQKQDGWPKKGEQIMPHGLQLGAANTPTWSPQVQGPMQYRGKLGRN